MVLVSVELAVPAGQSITALTKQYKGFMLVHITIDCAFTIRSLSRPWEIRIMPLVISNSSGRQNPCDPISSSSHNLDPPTEKT